VPQHRRINFLTFSRYACAFRPVNVRLYFANVASEVTEVGRISVVMHVSD